MKTKTLKWLCLATFLLANHTAFCITNPSDDDEPRKKRKFIEIYRIKDHEVLFDFRTRYFWAVGFSPPKVIGVRSIDDHGFRFTPATEVPDGMPPGVFDKFYRLSLLVEEIFIPYSDMKSVKFYSGVVIRTIDGKKYHFVCKHPRRLVRELRSHFQQ